MHRQLLEPPAGTKDANVPGVITSLKGKAESTALLAVGRPVDSIFVAFAACFEEVQRFLAKHA
jgi:hypothetical protein